LSFAPQEKFQLSRGVNNFSGGFLWTNFKNGFLMMFSVQVNAVPHPSCATRVGARCHKTAIRPGIGCFDFWRVAAKP